MKKILFIIFLIIQSVNVEANTLAGTTISNQATVEYSIANGIPNTMQSNVSSFIVNELVDVALDWSDTSQVNVSSPDTNKVLTFKLTNTGNGTQFYKLTENSNLGTGNFNPVPITGVSIYIENGFLSGLQLSGANQDIQYNNGNTIKLEAGEYKYIYLVHNIPSQQLVNYKGFAQLYVESTTNGVANATQAGTILQNVPNGNNLIDVILGYSLGKKYATGNYNVSGLIVNHSKSVLSVVDTIGGNLIMSGSQVEYEIKVDLSGIGDIQNFKISDTLPPEMKYINGTLKLNNTLISDSNVTNNIINVNVGTLTSPNIYKLTFKVLID